MALLIHWTKADTRVKTVGPFGPAHGILAQLTTPISIQVVSDWFTQARGPPESPVHVPRPPLTSPAQIMLSVRRLAYHVGWLHVERLNAVSSTSCSVRVACPPSTTAIRSVLLQFASPFEPEWLLDRPTYLSADLDFTAILLLLSIFYLFSPATLRARWTKLNQNRPHARK